MSDSGLQEEGQDSGERVEKSDQKAEGVEEVRSGDDSSEGDGVSGEDEARKRAEAQAAERRKAYRLNKVLGATMTANDGDATRTRLFVIDISVSGFRATDHRPPAEEECDISIMLTKDEEPFVSRMRVVWVKELTVSGMYQMGCEFVNLADEELLKLNSFIEHEKDVSAKASGAKTIKIDNPWTMI